MKRQRKKRGYLLLKSSESQERGGGFEGQRERESDMENLTEGGGVDREKEREIFELEILNGGGGLRERVKGNNPSTLGREREGERGRVKRKARVEKKGREREPFSLDSSPVGRN